MKTPSPGQSVGFILPEQQDPDGTIWPSRRQSPTSTSILETRLNEGCNLRTAEVQKVTGGQIMRKPVADDGRAIKDAMVLDDPSTDTRARSPVDLVANSPSPTSVYTVEVTTPVRDRFFTLERGFEDNLEYGLLNTLPDGWSTPKIRIRRTSIISINTSPIRKLPSPIASRGSGRFKVSKLDFSSLAESSGHKRVLDSDRSLSLRHYRPSRSSWKDVKRVKKHPSPSKGELEGLEAAFERYTNLHGAGATEEELDELARDFPPPYAALAPRDGNRLIKGPSATALGSGLWDSKSSVLGQASCTSQLRVEARLAVPFRPDAARADEFDELH
ncbi:hypothetical protein B0I35DRAFT_124650 [Stachybotrys elegans]|uniref:Uncharacterized protein n=1 Tax=Stachybotrys elegans TaxID=80388 RepID=A0A8K0T060_9HYPO|nr:hypothetical protein B0I35DRAFT_124650 [Stachybotrys elegans]